MMDDAIKSKANAGEFEVSTTMQVDCRIKKMLEEAGIHHYDPDVITHLTDYMQFYTTEVLEHSLKFMKHAGRADLLVDDVKLALDVVAKKSSDKRLTREELMELARKQNKSQLSECTIKNGIALPNSAYTLAERNYKLKNASSQLPVSSSNQMVAFTTIKTNTGTTLIRTSSIPMNLTSQRVLFKPNNTLFNQNDIKKLN